MLNLLRVRLKSFMQSLWGKIVSFFVSIWFKIKARLVFVAKRFWKRDYIPLYIAGILFAIIASVSGIVVAHDTNKNIDSYRKMQQIFFDAKYDLKKIRNGEMDVPRIFIPNLPSDFNMIESQKEKKEMFIKFLLPLLLLKNEEIMAQRKRVIAIGDKIKKGGKPTASEQTFLNDVRTEYKTDSNNIDDILIKLDEMSVSMAIGQAIQETGWGESRFLIKGNALFAEWTWGGEGMLPRARKSGLIHRIKTFPTLYHSVESYAKNLNRTKYYAGFRQMRSKLRAEGKSLDGAYLMSSMLRYSTEGNKYILDVKKIIQANRLNDFDKVKLAPIVDGRK